MPDTMHTLYYCLGGIFSVLLLATMIIFALKNSVHSAIGWSYNNASIVGG